MRNAIETMQNMQLQLPFGPLSFRHLFDYPENRPGTKSVSDLDDQRIDTPDRSVNMRAAMFMDANSWNSSLAA